VNQKYADLQSIDIRELIDKQRLSAFHYVTLFLCFLIVALDGFDTGAIGYIAPSLVQSWKISRETLGPVLSAALAGAGLGAMVAGPIADRIGRRAVLIGSVLIFGIWSLAAAHASSMGMLTLFRLLTGFGLGAAVPNAVTLMSEYAPNRIRGIVVNGMFMGFAAGLAAGGLLSAFMIPRFGWQSILLIGGVVPLALAIVLLLYLPESVKFLVARNRQPDSVRKILRRISLTEIPDGCLFTDEPAEDFNIKNRDPVRQLFTRRYILGTLMLWLSYFMCMAVYYLMTNWMPTIFKASGFTIHDSMIITSIFPIGGCFGIVFSGWLSDRFGSLFIISLFYSLMAVIVILIGLSLDYRMLLGCLIFILGILSGANASMAPLAAEFYPTGSRVTGVAWMLAIGRLGAVGGAFGGALLISSGWSLGLIFGFLSGPLVIAVFALKFLSNRSMTGRFGLQSNGPHFTQKTDA
jgi:AAHS family 4-hydroxybenzoate transporter-like MFS transporter